MDIRADSLSGDRGPRHCPLRRIHFGLLLKIIDSSLGLRVSQQAELQGWISQSTAKKATFPLNFTHSVLHQHGATFGTVIVSKQDPLIQRHAFFSA